MSIGLMIVARRCVCLRRSYLVITTNENGGLSRRDGSDKCFKVKASCDRSDMDSWNGTHVGHAGRGGGNRIKRRTTHLLVVCAEEKDALGGDILLGRLPQLQWRFGYLQGKHISIRHCITHRPRLGSHSRVLLPGSSGGRIQQQQRNLLCPATERILSFWP